MTNYPESLIEKLEAAKSRPNGKPASSYDWRAGIDYAINIIRQHTASPSEISVVDERMVEIVAKATEPNLWDHTHKPDSAGYWKNNARKKKVLKRARIAVAALKPYLRTTEPDEGETAEEIYQRLSKRAKIIGYELRKPEPVSVSLKKCAHANAVYQMTTDHDDITDEGSAKAVLDAAGVKYHD